MKHAAVLGAGIVGAACAAALARDGWRVTVVEPAVVGGGATAAGMGHVVVMDDSEAQFALTHYSRRLWDEASARLPASVEFERRGTLWVAADEEEMAEVRRKAEFYGSRGVRTEILGSRALAAAEPNLRAGLAGALLVPDDSVIYAPCAARWLLEESGAELRPAGPVDADVTICAAGAWSAELVPGLPVRPRKGHLAITDRYPEFLRHQIVELGYLKSAHGDAAESVAFNVQPRATGQVLIGSSRQFGVTHGGVDAPVLSRMLGRALEYMPGLAALSVIRTWTGFRAATPDKLPLIGPCPERERWFLATGHEGLGITTSLATGKLVADLLAGREPAIDSRPYLPCATRFASS
jgi:D-hydroxyproline dehydrogenase subunit beta